MIYRIESKIDGTVYFARRVHEPRPGDLDRNPSMQVDRCDGVTVYPRRNNVTITEVADEAAVNEFKVGDKAVIRKYGSSYAGIVRRVGTKRLDVEFTTVGGKTKLARGVPAAEVQVPGGALRRPPMTTSTGGA